MKRTRRYQVSETDQLEALTSPSRFDILTAVGSLGVCTASEIAKVSGRTQSSLYFHLDKLVAVGLLWREEHPGGARYQTPGELLSVRYEPSDPVRLELLTRTVSTVLRGIERAVRRALETGTAKVKGKNVDTIFASHRAYLTRDELREVTAHVEEINRICARARQSREGKLHTFVACMAPLPPRVQKRG